MLSACCGPCTGKITVNSARPLPLWSLILVDSVFCFNHPLTSVLWHVLILRVCTPQPPQISPLCTLIITSVSLQVTTSAFLELTPPPGSTEESVTTPQLLFHQIRIVVFLGHPLKEFWPLSRYLSRLYPWFSEPVPWVGIDLWMWASWREKWQISAKGKIIFSICSCVPPGRFFWILCDSYQTDPEDNGICRTQISFLPKSLQSIWED